jgi:hypothetical protein
MRNPDGTPRFKGALCEGTDAPGVPLAQLRVPPAGGRRQPSTADRDKPFGLLLKNYRLSDDIAFRFSNRGWEEWPLSAEKFAQWVHQINGDGYLCNLFMDYETFGEHQWADTGIFQFLDKLPEAIFDIAPGENHFARPARRSTGSTRWATTTCPSTSRGRTRSVT